MDEAQLSHSKRAIGKAIYSPRFAEGQAVATAGVTFTAEWYQEFDPEKAPANATPISTTPEPPPEPKAEAEPASGPGS
jgi:hypothetical protein